MSIISELFSYKTQLVRLVGKVSESINVVSGVPQLSVLGPLLFVLCTSELFHILGIIVWTMPMIL